MRWEERRNGQRAAFKRGARGHIRRSEVLWHVSAQSGGGRVRRGRDGHPGTHTPHVHHTQPPASRLAIEEHSVFSFGTTTVFITTLIAIINTWFYLH